MKLILEIMELFLVDPKEKKIGEKQGRSIIAGGGGGGGVTAPVLQGR